MSKELKRVPLDFDWEIGKLWSGYVNPYPRYECEDCEGLGWSDEYNKLSDLWYYGTKEDYVPNPFREGSRYNRSALSNNLTQEDVQVLVDAERLWDFTRVPLNDEQVDIVKKKIADGGNSWLPFDNGYVPTAQEVNEWNLKGMGHDSLNALNVLRARLEKEGKSHLCSSCGGDGNKWPNETAIVNYKNWKKQEPPTGEGYQLWDMKPLTPVFDTLESLCQYCEDESIYTFARYTATKEEWLEMLNQGFVHHKQGNNILF